MATINVLDATSNVVALEKPLAPGRAAAAASRPVALSSEDLAALTPSTPGRAAAAASRPVVLSTEDLAALTAIHDAVVASGGTAPPTLGRKAATGSSPVVLSNEDLAAIQAIAGGSGLTPGRKAASGSSPVVLSTEDLAALSVPAPGRKAATASQAVVLSTEDLAALTATSTVTIGDSAFAEYETVAAAATDQALGATGATGDYLSGVLIVPATTSPGAVSIKDGSGSAIPLFTGGATSVSNLVPFFVPLGIKSTGGAWKVTTGASVAAIGIGNFT